MEDKTNKTGIGVNKNRKPNQTEVSMSKKIKRKSLLVVGSFSKTIVRIITVLLVGLMILSLLVGTIMNDPDATSNVPKAIITLIIGYWLIPKAIDWLVRLDKKQISDIKKVLKQIKNKVIIFVKKKIDENKSKKKEVDENGREEDNKKDGSI
ncbi:hypothetical protein [Mammaliicoccus sciuri]|uniref:hypothetical protein n=1 Tax=Mammaliicoccus sciuri TaxID=1296 RepID=UPI003F577CD4